MPTDITYKYADKIHLDGESAPHPKRRRTEGPGQLTGGALADPLTGVVRGAVVDPLNVSSWSPRAKYLISKMRQMRFIDEATPAYLIVWLAKTADKLFIYAGYGKTGDATELLKRIHVGHTIIDQVLNADYADLSNNCSAANERDNKDIYWTFASAFLICFYEVKAKKLFSIQYYHPSALITQFLKLYPDFGVHVHDGLLVGRLLTFHLCMQVAVSAFGRGMEVSSSACLVELVTRMTEGREVALAINVLANPYSLPSMLGATAATTINSCRKTIFEKVFEIKRISSIHREKNQKSDEKANKRVNFAGKLPETQSSDHIA